ncbi:facilitated trehalose transporter Tret1-like isoform X1 [Bombyx mandarina]|uniref:Facilitated trehalose transporter Tret1-like isoform X1 n=2 Tax=Bombyx mandarina TaxID=7092 RepID=A0A6J2JFW7_BOMMA|nr:facilitated trehalose transporter Tret1-like isoform X1 [Bombyx mandarina]
MFEKHKFLIRQYAAVLTVNLSTACAGIGLGWISPVLVKLMDENEDILSPRISEVEISWLVSTSYLVAFLTNYPWGIVMDYFGRKTCIVFGMCLTMTVKFMLTFATKAWMLVVERAFSGTLSGMLICASVAYSAEISSKEIRGSLLSFININISLGTLMMFCFGPYLNYFHLNIAITCTVALCTVPILFLPESPYYLFSKGRIEESKKVLIYFHGSEYEATEEIEQYNLALNSKVNCLEIFKNKMLYKSLTIAVLFALLVNLIGQSIVINYLQSILEITHTNIKSELASVIVGVIQFVAGILAALVTDKVGRKPLLIVTLAGTAAGFTGLGTFFKLKELGYSTEGWINYLPLFSLVAVLFSYSTGPGSIFLTIVSELFEGPARASGVTISFSVASLTAFLLTKYFATFVKLIGPVYSYWSLAINTIVAGLFVVIFIPETKGKSFAEIQSILKSINEENQRDNREYQRTFSLKNTKLKTHF